MTKYKIGTQICLNSESQILYNITGTFVSEYMGLMYILLDIINDTELCVTEDFIDENLIDYKEEQDINIVNNFMNELIEESITNFRKIKSLTEENLNLRIKLNKILTQ